MFSPVAGLGTENRFSIFLGLVTRLATQPFYLVLKFQFLLLPSANFDIIRSGTGDRLVDFHFECPVLFCEFCEMCGYRHQLPPMEIADVEIVPHEIHVVQRLFVRRLNV
jgi:hypothetical protein